MMPSLGSEIGSLGLAPTYLRDLNDGVLHEKWFKYTPFPHAVLPNLFELGTYETIRSSCFESWVVDTEKSIVGKYGAVSHEAVVRRFYGSAFRSFLSQLTSRRLSRAADSYPQLRIISEERHGIEIHNDANLPYDVGIIFHMTRDWNKEIGGKLKLWARTPEGNFRLHSIYPPTENSLVILFLGDESYHSVEPLGRAYQRVTLIQEWKTCPPPAS